MRLITTASRLFRLVRARRAECSASRWAKAALLGAGCVLAGVAAEAAEPRRLTFAELAACPLVADAAEVASGASLTAPVRAANGAQVRIAGYMLPLSVDRGRARQFLLMRNQNACCFGQMPAANEYLVVETRAPGLPVRMDLPVAFVGRLRVAPVVSGGAVVQFYSLDETTLAEAER